MHDEFQQIKDDTEHDTHQSPLITTRGKPVFSKLLISIKDLNHSCWFVLK